MTRALSKSRRTVRLAASFIMLASLLPMAAQATQIQLTGTITSTFGFTANPFVKGQPLSGLFNVNLEPDNSFTRNDLTSFSLTIGPAIFDLAPSQFGSFNGSVDDNGMLTNLSLVTAFVQPDGVNGQYALGANGVRQAFSVTGASGSITQASFSGQVVPDAVADVPEPSSLWLLGLALAMIAGGATRLRRKATLPAVAA